MSRSRFVVGLSIALLTASAGVADALECTVGEMFAGAPDFKDPMERAVDGQGLLDVPPLGFRSLLFVGDKLVTPVGQELWYSDLSAPTPTLERLTGREDRNTRGSKPGTCREARFANISGIALMNDGSLAGADQTANNIFVITDPFGPACSVSFIAGATEAQEPVNLGQPAAEGDADGPGAGALLRAPDWVATLDDGAIYFTDTGNGKLKKVLPDAQHTVETVLTLPEGRYYAMLALNGLLYLIGNTASSEGLLLEIDPKTGKTFEVVRGRADLWNDYGSINLSGLATDGTGLITSQSGQVLYVTLEGSVTNIAGNGTYFELEPGYDPYEPHPAAELQLWSMRRTQTAGANVFLVYKDGYLYYSASGTTAYVVRIACQ